MERRRIVAKAVAITAVLLLAGVIQNLMSLYGNSGILDIIPIGGFGIITVILCAVAIVGIVAS